VAHGRGGLPNAGGSRAGGGRVDCLTRPGAPGSHAVLDGAGGARPPACCSHFGSIPAHGHQKTVLLLHVVSALLTYILPVPHAHPPPVSTNTPRFPSGNVPHDAERHVFARVVDYRQRRRPIDVPRRRRSTTRARRPAPNSGHRALQANSMAAQARVVPLAVEAAGTSTATAIAISRRDRTRRSGDQARRCTKRRTTGTNAKSELLPPEGP
jgi:hypothetical protein